MCGVVASIALSCTKEIAPVDEPETPSGETTETGIPEGFVELTLTAVCDSDTKTSLDGSGYTVWNENDKIKVICSGETASDFTLQDGAGTTTGDFRGLVPSGKSAIYAVYPSTAYSSRSGTNVVVTVPSSQDGGFASGNIAVAKIASGTHDMQFRNVAALLSFTLKEGSEVSKIEVQSVDDTPLQGSLTVDCSGENPTPTASSSGDNLVTLTTSGAGTYYMAVLPVGSFSTPGAYSKGLLIRYFTGTSGSYTETGSYYLKKNLALAKNKIYPIGEVETDKNYYVTVSGAGLKNGMNWTNALSKDQMWKMLQLAGTDSAVDAAKLAVVDGATFHLGAGTYNLGDTPLLSFNEDDPVTITFKGDYPAEGGSQTRPTASVDNRAYFTGNDTHSALILRGNLDVRFDGIGFINGYATGDEESTDTGKTAAALDCLGSNVSISMSHCSVKNNTHKSYTSGTGNWGAGIRLNGVSSFSADSVTFAHNTAFAAPAISIRNCSPSFTDCAFTDNKSCNDCGAVYVTTGATASFTDCTFTGNEAINEDGAEDNSSYGKGCGGAILTKNGAVITITRGTFSGNKAWRGGAIFLKNNGANSNKLTATGTSFDGNGGGNTRGGGAIYAEEGFTLDDCTFSNNTAALWGGAIESVSAKSYYVRGGTFYHNTSGSGGGAICHEGGTLTMAKNPSTKNTVSFTENSTSGKGGALWLEKAASISNTSFSSNSSVEEGGAVYVHSDNIAMSDVTFTGNSSDSNGGSVYVKNGKTTIHDASFTGNHANLGGAMYAESTVENWKAQFNSNHATEGGAICIEQTSGNHAWFDRCSFSERNYITYVKGIGTTIKVSASDEFCMNNCSIDDGTYNQNAENNFSRTSWIAVTAAKSMFSNCSFIGYVRKGTNGSTTISSGEKGSMIYISPTVAANTCFFINSIVACNNKSFQSWNDSGFGHVKLYQTFYNTTQDLTIDGTPDGGASGVTNGDVGNASWSSNCWTWNGEINGSNVSKATAGDILSQMNTVSSSFVSWLGTDKYLDGRSVKRGAGQDADEWWPGAYQPN